MLRPLLIPSALLLALTASAQVHDHRTCGAHTFTGRHLEQQGLSTDILRALPVPQSVARGGILTIPVVVHVIWNTSAENVPTSTINALIAELNQDYSGTNPDIASVRSQFTGVVGSAGFQFCLAQVDPSGAATTGITRTQTSDTWFDPDNQTDAMKSAPLGHAPWDTERYLNIWICDITSGAVGSEIVVGYAYLPVGNVVGSAIDGLVIDYDYGTEVGARTATHEIGHYFGLMHTFDEEGNCVDSDGFTDTPISNAPTYSCSNTNLRRCNNTLTQYENFMDYSTCTVMFTDQQAAYMANVVQNVRGGLLLNQACSGPVTGLCIPSSTNGTGGGDYVNSVVLNSIQNIDSGGDTEPTYTDFSGTYSTSLVRNGHYSILIEGGSYVEGDNYAAWIDFNHNNAFEAGEKLGEFATDTAAQTGLITFSVPPNAMLGTTTLRVRGVYFNEGEPTSVDPCFNFAFGETEDYGITILVAPSDFCTPGTIFGTADGDFINDVGLGNISNLNTGSATGPSYIDYSSTVSTPLMRNEEYVLTIRSGNYFPDTYGAWIDFDQNDLFETGEKIGEFVTEVVSETNEITFTVPANAVMGNTRMRVRGVFTSDGEPNPLDPCYPYAYGETEDYRIVIEQNTGINGGGLGHFGLFPNPASTLVTLDLPSAERANVVVMDAQGRLVHTQQSTSQRSMLDVSGIAAGTYMVRVEQAGSISTERLEILGE
jgi:hypothetical protein